MMIPQRVRARQEDEWIRIKILPLAHRRRSAAQEKEVIRRCHTT